MRTSGRVKLISAMQFVKRHSGIPTGTWSTPFISIRTYSSPFTKFLQGHDNILLIEPKDYEPFIWLMNHSDMILIDQGGVQAEAPSLGKPVLVMREVTVRPESVEAGTVRLVGTDSGKILAGLEEIMLNEDVYNDMSRSHNPYGDGKVAARILESLRQRRIRLTLPGR